MLDWGMPDNRIADNLSTLIQGGHDTTTYPIAMTLREIAKNPEIQNRIYAEITNVMGKDKDTPINSETMDKMPYLHALAKEAIRKHMPAPFIDRITLYDMSINNIKVPKGTHVLFDLRGILQSEENYEDPLDFKPERFLKENITPKGQKAFVGFGYGAKACVGKGFAYTVMKLLIIKIVREFEIVYVEHDVECVADVFFRSLTGIQVAFRKRD